MTWKCLAALTICLSVGMLLAPAGAADAKKGDDATKKKDPGTDKQARSDKDLLQGKWKAVAATRDGKARTEEELKDKPMMLTFEGDKATLRDGDRDVGEPVTFKLDPSKKPKQIDVKPPAGSDGTERPMMKGIYELKGDTLKLAFKRAEEPGQSPERPTDFTPGERGMVVTLERQKS